MAKGVVIVKGGMDTEEFMRDSSSVDSSVSSVISNKKPFMNSDNVENASVENDVLEIENAMESASTSEVEVDNSFAGRNNSLNVSSSKGISKSEMLLQQLGIDINELENDNSRNLDNYLARAKESLLQTQELKNIKSTVKLEELKKIEKKLAKTFGLKENEVKGKRVEEIIDYVSGKLKNVSDTIDYEGTVEQEENIAIPTNPLLKIGSNDIYGADGLNNGQNEASINEGENGNETKSFQNTLNVLAAEGKSLDVLDPNRNAQLALNLLKTEKETLSKELTEKSNKLLEYESELEKLRLEKERLENEELVKYKTELEKFKSENIWKTLEDSIFSYLPGMNVVLTENQLRQFIFPELRKYLETKFVIEQNDNSDISLTSRFGVGKGELKRELYDYFRKNNLIAKNNFTKNYMENLIKLQAQGMPEPDNTIGGAAYLAEAQRNLERIKQNL